ncbi:MAG TPA: hypothetical protein VFL57_04800 [Bryobacteraceae bacterium]|nr:hypothetical protein [Bryobacteraceae bacterium]
MAAALDIPLVLGAVAGSGPQPVGPNLISYAPAPETVALATTGFDDELLEIVHSAAESDPPAPMQPPLAIPLRLSAPSAAELIDSLAAMPSPAGAEAAAELLPLLRSRLVSGPNPTAKPAAAEATKAQSEAAKAESAARATPQEAAKREAAKPKITIRPAEPPRSAKPDVRRPATIAARTNVAPAAVPEHQPEPQTGPAPPAKPVVIPIRKPDPAAAAVAKAEQAPPMIGLGAAQPASGASMKIGAVAAGLIVVAGAAWFFLRDRSPVKVDAASAGTAREVVEPLPALGGAGWTSNWGADAPVNNGKHISIFRPSMATPDYRIEIHGQIERKALGWIFRAHDARNYYVMKLEWIKPGPQPITALIKYAVVDGKETTRTQVLLSLPALSMTTLYRVRTDVKGNKFTTHVNDQPVDYWTDDRIKVGGAGIYADAGERALVKTTSIAALR